MNRTVTLLTSLAVALCGLIAIELFESTEDRADISPGAAPAGLEANHVSVERGDTQMTATILARPLFRADRKPAPEEAGNGRGSQPAGLPRLAGIMLSNGARLAIFQPSGGGRAIAIGEGETVAGWRVKQIAADSVTLNGPDGTRRLEPKFDTTAPSASAIGPAFAPSPPPGPSGGAPRNNLNRGSAPRQGD